jgi:hypothetical protein
VFPSGVLLLPLFTVLLYFVCIFRSRLPDLLHWVAGLISLDPQQRLVYSVLKNDIRLLSEARLMEEPRPGALLARGCWAVGRAIILPLWWRGEMVVEKVYQESKDDTVAPSAAHPRHGGGL